jgi:hypothetical protein
MRVGSLLCVRGTIPRTTALPKSLRTAFPFRTIRALRTVRPLDQAPEARRQNLRSADHGVPGRVDPIQRMA